MIKQSSKLGILLILLCSFLLTFSVEGYSSYVPQLYGVSKDGKLSIFLQTGAVIEVGPLFPDTTGTPVVSALTVEWNVGPHQFYVWLNSLGSSGEIGRLLTVFPSTGVAIPVDETTEPQGALEALAISPDGRLFGLKDYLWEIDMSTGAKTLVGSFRDYQVLAADFSPGGTLYGVTAGDELVTIDTNNANVGFVAELSDEIGTIGSIEFTGAENNALAGSASDGPQGDILFWIDINNGTVSEIQSLTSVSAPQGMGYAFDWHLCEFSGEPIHGSIITRSNCGDGEVGLLDTKWLPFDGLRKVLEADSGEKLELSCVDGSSYGLFYTPRPDPFAGGGAGASSYRVGICPFMLGCNRGSFFYSGDRNKNGKPDCFVKTVWISKDYGANDVPNPWTKEKSENPPLLDWAESVNTVHTKCLFNCTGDLEKISHKFEYKEGPPAVSCTSGKYEGELAGRTTVVDPPVGPETEEFFDEVFSALLELPLGDEPMKMDLSEPCDLDGDGDCDRSDFEFIEGAMDTCRTEDGYHPAADINADGCVTLVDQNYVFPNEPPVAICQDKTVSADPSSCSVAVSVDNGSYDPEGKSITVVQTPPGPYGLGVTNVTLMVTDDQGGVDSCQAAVTVEDTTSPKVTMSVQKDSLWPPNHRMVDVGFDHEASDNCDPNPVVTISITSDEPTTTIKGAGDRVYSPDAVIKNDERILLRAERSGEGDGRVYVIEVIGDDASGNTNSSSLPVKVDYDKDNPAIDSGQNYDATQLN